MVVEARKDFYAFEGIGSVRNVDDDADQHQEPAAETQQIKLHGLLIFSQLLHLSSVADIISCAVEHNRLTAELIRNITSLCHT